MILPTVKLWNKDEDNNNINNSDIGPGGTIVGSITHEAAKFNNGSVAGNSTSGFKYNRLGIVPNANKYVIDFWVKWKVNSAVWGGSSEFMVGDRRFLSYHGITFGLSPTFGIQWIITIKDGGGDTAYYSPIISFSAGDLQHVEIVIDNTASFDGAKTWTVIVDGVEAFSNTNAFNFVSLNPDYGFQGAIVPPSSFASSLTQGAIDNIKVYDEYGVLIYEEIRDNRGNEDFPAITAPIIESRLPTYKRKIFIAGIDVYQLGKVLDYPDIEYERSFDIDRLFVNEVKIKCNNVDKFFSVDNPVSPYSVINLIRAPIETYDKDGILSFQGENVSKPKRNETGLTAEFRARNKYYSSRYERITYSSGGNETAVDAVTKILTNLGIEDIIDNKSFERSKAILQNNNIDIQVTLTGDDDLNLIQILEKLAQYSVADIYDFKGKVHFQVWESLTDRIISKNIDLNDVGIIRKPVIDPFIGEKHLINDYEIHYAGDGGTAITDAAANNIGALSRSRNLVHSNKFVQGITPIEIQTLAAAIWIGQQYMKRTHKNFLTNPEHLQKTSFEMDDEKFDYFDFTTVFGLDYSPEAWSNKAHEMFKLIYKDKTNSVGIEAFEIAS